MVVSDFISHTRCTGMRITGMKNKTLLFYFALPFVISCNSKHPAKPDETTTSGNISISVDETFRPVIEAEHYTFESIYDKAKININYTNEVDAFNDLLSDSARLIVVS